MLNITVGLVNSKMYLRNITYDMGFTDEQNNEVI